MSQNLGLPFFYKKHLNNFVFIMAKELYLYSPIYDFVAENLISQLEENTNEDITLRMNTPGGEVFAGWGVIAKMQEHKGKITVKIDGAVMSMGAVILPFADKVEALDVSTIMLHRASMYIENDADQVLLDTVNASLRAKLESKIDVKKLKELKGVSIKNLFEDEKRIDLFLTAKEAKAIGLIDKINTINPKELKAFNEKMFSIAAKHEPITTLNPIKMTIEKLKAENPDVFAQILALGVAQEKDRVEAILVFNEIDPVAVKAAVEGGKNLTQKQMADFALKAMSVKTLEAIKKDSEGNIITDETSTVKTEKENTLADFEKSLDASLKLKTIK